VMAEVVSNSFEDRSIEGIRFIFIIFFVLFESFRLLISSVSRDTRNTPAPRTLP